MLSAQKSLEMFRKQPELIKLIYLYRYISLLCTSFFYIIGVANHSADRKLFIILCITMSSIILSNLYMKNKGMTTHIMLLVSIETLGNILILIPSGGIKSPYVWYCLNTLLIASVELKRYYCWLNLGIYLLVVNLLTQVIQSRTANSYTETFNIESNLALSLILIILAMQLLTRYAKGIENESKKLTAANAQLNLANRKIKRSMTYVIELYQAINLLSVQNNKTQVHDLITYYAKKITQSNTVLFYSITGNQNEIIIKTDGDSEILKEQLMIKLSEVLDQCLEYEVPIELDIDEKKYLLVFVKSSYLVYGILGIELMQYIDADEHKENIEQLKVLSGLSSIVLEKIELERVNGRLLVAEEQNRIACEIHDSILQRLFNISCRIFTLSRQQKELKAEEVSDNLLLIKNSIKNIMKDLRTVIYGLSWQKEGSDHFLTDIQSRINEISSLNGNDIQFNAVGDASNLPVSKKKALYRIICEGIGNAIRHGKASQIKVYLEVNPARTILNITDNGSGFDVKIAQAKERNGMGIRNIHQLTYSLGGDICFHSEIGKGTEIEIIIPNQIHEEKIV